MSLSRREAREAVFGLLFETEFKKEEDPKEIFAISCDDREIGQDDYIKNAYFGVCENLGTIDALINRHSNGSLFFPDRVPFCVCPFMKCCFSRIFRTAFP